MIDIVKVTSSGRSMKIELSDGETLRVPPGRMPSGLIAEGRTITDTEYRQLKEESERFLCGEKAVAYIAMKSCSSRQIAQYLKKKNFSEEIIKETILHLVELRYINDHEFSVDYIRSRKGRRAIGRNRLVHELAGKGVSRKIIDRAIKETGSEKDDIEEVYELARKKYERLKDKPNGLARTGFYLQGRGFGQEAIRRVLRMLDKDAGTEDGS